MASDVATVELPRIVKLPLRFRPLPPRRLPRFAAVLSRTKEAPVFTVSAVLLPLKAPEPWSRNVPPFTVVLVYVLPLLVRMSELAPTLVRVKRPAAAPLIVMSPAPGARLLLPTLVAAPNVRPPVMVAAEPLVLTSAPSVLGPTRLASPAPLITIASAVVCPLRSRVA